MIQLFRSRRKKGDWKEVKIWQKRCEAGRFFFSEVIPCSVKSFIGVFSIIDKQPLSGVHFLSPY